MKKLIFITIGFFLLASCSKRYTFVEEIKKVSVLGPSSIDEKAPEIIKAKSDTDAYIDAYTKFCISLKVYKEMSDDGYGEYLDVPLSFKLYNSEGYDISNISFVTKNRQEKEIYESLLGIINSESKTATPSAPSIDSAKIKELLPYFTANKDEFDPQGGTWYKPKSAPKYTNRNGIYLYFRTTNSGVEPLRFRVQYFADDWLFFKKIQFSIDSNAYEYIPLVTETDNGGGDIWEWFDESVRSTDKPLIEALANAKSAKMKFIGRQYYDIKSISKQQITDINRTIELYKAMGGTF